jgi:hypothetical protein
MALMGQKGWTLHEERREPGQREISHVVSCIQASPLVRQGPAAPTQGIEEAIQGWHSRVESQIGRQGNQERQCLRSGGNCCIGDSPNRFNP